MMTQVTLNLSEKASEKLTKLSKKLGISSDEFATICFEFVNAEHQGIVAAAAAIRERKPKKAVSKKNLSRHLNQLSAEQVELLLSKAAKKNKN